ncbi:MAG: hypothetical protein ACLFQB_03440 [Chitinispirillaceae bacterium]
MSSGQFIYGYGTEVPQTHQLSAGPLSLLYENGYIRSICAGNNELLRRIYVAVRDEFWNTIEYTVTDEKIEKKADSFLATFLCHHKRGAVDFAWKGVVRGSENGRVEFSMDGEALSRFQTWRIGFCILHPLDFSGKPVRVAHAGGKESEYRFPVSIEPYQPIMNISSMITYLSPSESVKISTEGEVFEMEDQRNWTDATFKMYCPPAAEPGLHYVDEGSEVSQKVALEISENVASSEKTEKSVGAVLDVRKTSSPFPFSRLGSCLDPCTDISSETLRLLELLSFSFYRVDIDFCDSGLTGKLKASADICSVLDTSLELALHFTSDYKKETEELLCALRSVQLPVKRFLVFSTEERVTPEPLTAYVRGALKAYSPRALVGGGTDNYYVELNRKHPPVKKLDCLSFSVNPQVHTFDNSAVMENAPGVGEVLGDIRRFSGDLPVGVSPVTLRPRRRADTPLKDGGPDGRLWGLFGAAWTLRNFSSCVTGKADSVTYFDLFGESGFVDMDKERVAPVFHLFAWLNEYVQGECRLLHCGDRNVSAVLLSRENSCRLIVANCSGEECRIDLRNMKSERAGVKYLNEKAVDDPVAFLCTEGERFSSDSGLKLGPYGIAAIEYGTEES